MERSQEIAGIGEDDQALRVIAAAEGSAPHGAGYRIYDETDVHTLHFIRRARDLGFSIQEIQQLLGLWQDQRRASADVRRIAQRHITALDQKIEELQGMRRTLEQLVHHCHGDQRPECPILQDLAAVSREQDHS